MEKNYIYILTLLVFHIPLKEYVYDLKNSFKKCKSFNFETFEFI